MPVQSGVTFILWDTIYVIFCISDTIFSKKPQDFPESLLIQSPCLECEVYSIWGGRCLFTNRYNFWKNDSSKVCFTIKHLISELSRVKPFVERMINAGKITLDMFDYPPYNKSCDIIP